MDLDKLRSELDYDAEAGVFKWRIAKQGGKPAGTVAGVVDKSTGFIKIGFDKKLHYGHRLAYIYVHGDIPRNVVVKQVNDKRDDIRLVNLSIGVKANRGQGRKRK